MEQTAIAIGALREAARLLERAQESSRRATALRKAAGILAGLDPAQAAELAANGQWQSLSGIGETSAGIIVAALAGREAAYLTTLRQRGPLVDPEPALRGLLRGDLHTHTDASDGSVPLVEMVEAAAALGHEYLAVTDHSPRLRVANGLSVERLEAQLAAIERLNGTAPLRVLSGIEVDILADGRLDQRDDLLRRLDVVVASVHSELRMPAEAMTLRMVAAIANPRVDVLGHCTGRLVAGERGTRPQSAFDAEVVFEACRQFGVAVEVNSRPERCDPPDDLLALAAEIGCDFAIDTDSHAPGQLDFLSYGAARAEAAGIGADRILNTLDTEALLTRTRR
jgi:putative hydrolase